MKILARFCNLCASSGIVRLARGMYYVQETNRHHDACTTHLKAVKSAGFEIDKRYKMPRAVSPKHFAE